MPPTICNAGRCNVCFFHKLPQKKDTKSCSACKLIVYCSAEHQKLDWPVHKGFCKIIQKIIKVQNLSYAHYICGVPKNTQDLERSIVILKYLLQADLERDLLFHEHELITFPVYCNICFKFDITTKWNCTTCEAIFYCSDNCRVIDSLKAHGKICTDLRTLYNLYDEYEFNFKLKYKMSKIDLIELKNVLEVVKTLARGKLSIPDTPINLNEYHRFSSACTYSYAMTILYVISQCVRLDESTKTFTIYILAYREDLKFFQDKHCKFLISQLPGVQFLKLIFIGKDLPHQDESMKFRLHIDGANKEVEIQFYNDEFENYLVKKKLESNLGRICNLLISFNCSFSDYARTPDTPGRKTIEKFLNMYRTTIAFTSYTLMESRLDLNAIQVQSQLNKKRVQILIRNLKNKFCDLRPIRNWEINDHQNDRIFHRNGFLCAIKPNTPINKPNIELIKIR